MRTVYLGTSEFAAAVLDRLVVSAHRPQLVAGIGAVVITAVIHHFLTRTKLGAALEATAADKEAAQLMGIDSHRMFALAWGIGALLTSNRWVVLAGAAANTAFFIGWVMAKTSGISFVHGLDVAITTTAQTDAEAFTLLDALGMPFAG